MAVHPALGKSGPQATVAAFVKSKTDAVAKPPVQEPRPVVASVKVKDVVLSTDATLKPVVGRPVVEETGVLNFSWLRVPMTPEIMSDSPAVNPCGEAVVTVTVVPDSVAPVMSMEEE